MRVPSTEQYTTTTIRICGGKIHILRVYVFFYSNSIRIYPHIYYTRYNILLYIVSVFARVHKNVFVRVKTNFYERIMKEICFTVYSVYHKCGIVL